MKTFKCLQCSANFASKFSRDRHILRIHTNANLIHQCAICGNVFPTVKELKIHRKTHVPPTGFTIVASAFRKTCVLYRKTYEERMETLAQAFLNDKEDISKVLEHEVNRKKSIKASLIFHAEFLRDPDGTGKNVESYVVHLRSRTIQIYSIEIISSFMHNAQITAQNRIDDFLEHGSGWVLDEILCTDIEIGGCPPLNGSCNLLSIKYLKSLKKIPPISNMQQCFFEAIAFHFKRTTNVKVLNKFIDRKLNVTIPTPVKVTDISKFENANSKLNIKINVLYAEDNEIYPLYVSKIVGSAKNYINLLLFKTIVDGNPVNHYSYIENVDIFLRRTYGEKSEKKSYERSFRCPNCLGKFSSDKIVSEHIQLCSKNKPQKVNIPQEGEVLKFKNHANKFFTPIVGFFDFEACQKKPKYACATCGNGVCKHKTLVSTMQEPTTYSLLIIQTENNVVLHKNTYTGKDCAKKLIDELLGLEEKLCAKFKLYEKLPPLTKVQKKLFLRAKVCHICEEKLMGDKVKDHCHATGRYLGAAHNSCNLNRSVRVEIPLYCHNLQGYDSHFILQSLRNDKRIKNVSALPYNTEKFRTFIINSYHFLDSLAFLNALLAELVSDLASTPNFDFPILDQMKLYNSDNKKDLKPLLIRKGVYPYESVTSIKMLKKTKSIPPIENFYSSLTDSTVNAVDYAHAQKVFSAFNCDNLLDYTELYCATDVALLAEVMLQFRKVVHEEFGLDCW
jgi:DNA polymerase type B, organellar and viral